MFSHCSDLFIISVLEGNGRHKLTTYTFLYSGAGVRTGCMSLEQGYQVAPDRMLQARVVLIHLRNGVLAWKPRAETRALLWSTVYGGLVGKIVRWVNEAGSWWVWHRSEVVKAAPSGGQSFPVVPIISCSSFFFFLPKKSDTKIL